MRGKAEHLHQCDESLRITPAYAGKSSRVCTKSFYSGDHPRLCGEKTPTKTYDPDNEGSPPPMRGKGSVVRILSLTVRITPAYAGKSIFGTP